MKWSHLARLLIARKALLLGLINQGKCLAVTHRVVHSRGSSLIAVLSFIAGSLSLFPPATTTSTLLICWWRFWRWAFGGSTTVENSLGCEVAWAWWWGCCWYRWRRVYDLCCSCGLRWNIMRGQCCKQRDFTTSQPGQNSTVDISLSWK